MRPRNPAELLSGSSPDDRQLRQCDGLIHMQPSSHRQTCEAGRPSSSDWTRTLWADFQMLSMRKNSKKKKGSASRSLSDSADRVVMVCEDVPSEGSSGDSGRGSTSSGALAGGDKLCHGCSSRSFQEKRERSSSRPANQNSARGIRRTEASPARGPTGGRSTLCIRELYEPAASVARCTLGICKLSIRLSTAGIYVHLKRLNYIMKKFSQVCVRGRCIQTFSSAVLRRFNARGVIPAVDSLTSAG